MTGVFFTARLGSKRLQSKHLIEVGDFTFLEWMIKRFQHSFEKQIEEGEVKLVITTSVNPENIAFEKYADSLGIAVFYGSNDNIPFRHLQCAKKYNMSSIISIDGDDTLCSTEAAMTVFASLQNKSADRIVTNGLPLGMNVSGYTTAYLEECLIAAAQQKLETGWGRIFDDAKTRLIQFDGYENDEDVRLTLDYDDDARFFSAVIAKLGDKTIGISDRDLIDFIRENNFEKINNHLSEEYWNNYNSEKQKEQEL
ncbi:MAG: hypothetical protein NT150_04580 [Bacteroidetes bacterium]|nr:hypothetical protein [Bacteroidota bacterium]